MNFTKALAGYLTKFSYDKIGKNVLSPSKEQQKIMTERKRQWTLKNSGHFYCGENNEKKKESKKEPESFTKFLSSIHHHHHFLLHADDMLTSPLDNLVHIYAV